MTTYTYRRDLINGRQSRTVTVASGTRQRQLLSLDGNGYQMRSETAAALAILNDWRGSYRFAVEHSMELAKIMHEHCQMHATAPYEVTTDGLVMICAEGAAQA